MDVPWPLIATSLGIIATGIVGIIQMSRKLDVIAERLKNVSKRQDGHSQDIDDLKDFKARAEQHLRMRTH